MSTDLPPNPEVLEAQARVCTGPHQTRPLGRKPGDPDPGDILRTIIESAAGRLEENPVSPAQMGSFFTGMTLRKTFPRETAWSPAEVDAFRRYQAELSSLPEDIRFLIHPDGGLVPHNSDEAPVLSALEFVLKGQQLTYEATSLALDAVIHGKVRDSLKAALLIGQRMNRETADELRAYLDVAFPPEAVRTLDVPHLTHLGEPYDGSARTFRPTVFIAAVRAALGRPSVLHGAGQMPPKFGVTDEQILSALGARVDLSLDDAAILIQSPDAGFAYVSQKTFAPGLHELINLRLHIKKRPAWSTTEKAQQLFRAPSGNHMIIGFFHIGYEGPLLELMKARGLDVGLAIKGEEGTSHFGLRLGKPSSDDRRAINYTEGFRGNAKIKQDIDPEAFGFSYSESPRLPSVTPQTIADAGRAALAGAPGPNLDRILLNVAAKDHLLGFAPSFETSLALARDAVLSGKALANLNAYVEGSKRLSVSATN